MAKLPTSTEDDVARFLKQVSQTTAPPRQQGSRGRLIFAMDATASREPSWDRACQIQGDMFSETSFLGGLAVQLLYYRGYRQCRASKWAINPAELLRFMTSVRCLGGATQIEKILKHTIRENDKKKVNALIFIGDAMEENIDLLCHQAGELGLLKVPVFIFHEGGEQIAERAFRQIARLSGGVYCRFDSNSAQQLKDLLAAVAVYAAGGRQAMLEYGQRKGGAALRLTHQLSGKRS
jgi:hypothetical protein